MAQTELVSNDNRRPGTRAATDPAAGEEEASSLHPSVRLPGRTAIASSLARPDPQAALLMAQELLRYRPTEAGYDAWLARITELVNTAGAAPAPSRSLPPPPPRGAEAEHGAPPPPLPSNDSAGHRRGAHAWEPSRNASSPDPDDASCQIIRRAPPDARVLLEQQRQCQDRTIQEVTAAGRQNRAALAGGVTSSSGGCRAFTRELRRVVWPTKFKPNLPPRYDGTPNPMEFLQLYTLSIEAVNGDDKVMVN